MRVLIPLALILSLAGCTVGRAIDNARSLGARVEADTTRVLNVRSEMEQEFLDLTVEWCQLLAEDARQKAANRFDRSILVTALLMMADGDNEGARAALQTETLSVDDIEKAYKRAIDCYGKQPSVLRPLRAARDVKKVIRGLRSSEAE